MLDKQRAVGGAIEAGAKVAVYLSYKEPDSTHLTLHQVLVTSVQHGAVPATATAIASTRRKAVDLVTLAATGADAEKIVFAAEHGTVWLTVEPEDADTHRDQGPHEGKPLPMSPIAVYSSSLAMRHRIEHLAGRYGAINSTRPVSRRTSRRTWCCWTAPTAWRCPLELAGRWHRQRPTASVILVCPTVHRSAWTALRAGVYDIVSPEADDD